MQTFTGAASARKQGKNLIPWVGMCFPPAILPYWLVGDKEIDIKSDANDLELRAKY